ncbi:MAG: PQQ-binding-like beta-propeller repeat protein [Rubripirellula sp.]
MPNQSLSVFQSLVSVTLVMIAVHCSAVEPTHSIESNWSQFRGPAGLGISAATHVPTEFDAKQVGWQVDLPVVGHSSPVVWGNHIFLTGATQKGDAVQRHLLCLARDTGKLIWNEVAATGEGEKLHKMNSWATPSCATDGERVVAFFGAGGLHCYDNQGKRLWSRDLGNFPGGWGVGASPIFVDDMVIQNGDAEGDSFLIAVDKKTGKDIWRTPRKSKPRGGWSTPIVIEAAGRRELVLNGEFGVSAYDVSTGKPLWNCKGFNGRGTPVPAWGHGLLHVVNGKTGDIYAVKPGGSGDVTETHMAWHTDRRGGRDLPSPVLAGDCLVAINMAGIATGYDAKSGEELWKERLGGNYSGSPIVVGGLVYALAENGEVLVMKCGREFELISRNAFSSDDEEIFRSSISVSDGELLIRSDHRLYCVGE